jgi:hypothetical protein
MEGTGGAGARVDTYRQLHTTRRWTNEETRAMRVTSLLGARRRRDRYGFWGGTGMPGIFTLTAPR